MFKKMLSLVLTFVLVFSVAAIPASASSSVPTGESFPQGEVGDDGIIYIDTSSQEEYDQVVAQIEEDNQTAQELWEEALRQSEQEENGIPESNGRSPRAYMTVQAYSGNETFVCSGQTQLDQYKNTLWTSVYSINTYTSGYGDTVSQNWYNTTLIDGRRTCAANISLTFGVKNMWGHYEYYSRYAYVEFYTNKGYWVSWR